MTTIPEIIDNRKVLLKDVINTLLKNTTDAKIATGYFYLNGFELIRENIKPELNLDILIGVETDQITALTIQEGYDQKQEENKNKIIDEMLKHINYISDDVKEGINTLSQLIRDGKVNVKIYTKTS